jgi:hypothetical protein
VKLGAHSQTWTYLLWHACVRVRPYIRVILYVRVYVFVFVCD